MKTWRITVKIKGAGGALWVPANPETFKAENIEEAIKFLIGNTNFPNNDLVKTIAINLEEKE